MNTQKNNFEKQFPEKFSNSGHLNPERYDSQLEKKYRQREKERKTEREKER